ncbi:MAG: chemotaxis protein CheW [Prochloron sp. SP5CPC1]|nr:chemotaxis protein CheW [Candidatus Paraprochloron terpiosi SP5CPC1]
MVSQPDFLTEAGRAFSTEISLLESPVGEPYLRFYLPSGDEFALPATGIREVMQQSPDRITSIPNASPLLLGTINLRGQVIWVVNLGQFLGDPAPLKTERPEIPVIAIVDEETILGLAIDRLSEMDWREPRGTTFVDRKQLRCGTNIPETMAPFVEGEWVLDSESKKFLRLLDLVAILRWSWDGWHLKMRSPC